MKENKNVDTTKTITHLGLCAGYGGIELGLKRVIPNLRSVALCEIEGFAVANLVAKMEEGLMDCAPIWTDLKSFPWESFRDRVDILTGGYPCQPFSAAGKRLGTEDPRHLWPFIASGIRLLRPKLCFFENVEGHISLGLREVVGELEQIGYQTAFGIFSAREVGSVHQRKRVFIMAYLKCAGLEGFRPDPRQSKEFQLGDCGGEGCGELANTLCNGSGEGWLIRQGADGAESVSNGESWGAWPSRPGEPQQGCELEHARVSSENSHAAQCWSWDVSRQGTAGQSSCGTPWPSRPGEAQHGWEPPRVVANSLIVGRRGGNYGDEGGLRGKIQTTGSCGSRGEVMGNTAEQGCQRSGGANDPRGTINRPTESNGGCAYGAMEQSQRQTEPTLGRDAHGVADRLDYAELCVSCDNRTDELRLLGNGVVPATAERAFRTLLEELNT